MWRPREAWLGRRPGGERLAGHSKPGSAWAPSAHPAVRGEAGLGPRKRAGLAATCIWTLNIKQVEKDSAGRTWAPSPAGPGGRLLALQGPPRH